MQTYNLFISHSWAYKNQYDNLIQLLDNGSYFNYKNYSVPRNDPIHTNGTNVQLKAAISEKIRNSHVILVLAGVYSTYSKWINIEIGIAKNEYSLEKPIIAIEPRGSENTSQYVKENANKIVGWNSSSIINAIKELA